MNFSFVQITDHHITASDAELLEGFSSRHALRAVLAHISQNVGKHADFIVSTGDLVESPSEASYQGFLQLLHTRDGFSEAPGPLLISPGELHEFPMYVLPGNHDDRSDFFKYLFPRSPASSLMNLSFVHKGVQFICLDWGTQSKANAHPDMLSFLAQSLELGLPSIILMHHQPVPIGSRWLDDFIANDIDQFWKTVSGKHVLGIFCGHVHISYEKIVQGIPVFGLRSTSYSFVLQDEPLACLLYDPIIAWLPCKTACSPPGSSKCLCSPAAKCRTGFHKREEPVTAQIPDKITINAHVFSIVGVYGGELFTPQSVGILPLPAMTSCWRGYVCHYKVRDDTLILDELQVSIQTIPLPGSEQALSSQVAPLINEVQPSGKRSSFNTIYENLNLDIPFTGSLFAGDGFIQSLYVHMGFQPAWKYETVFELILRMERCKRFRI